MPKYPAFEVTAPPEPAHPAATQALIRIGVLLADAHRDQAATSNWRGQL